MHARLHDWQTDFPVVYQKLIRENGCGLVAVWALPYVLCTAAQCRTEILAIALGTTQGLAR